MPEDNKNTKTPFTSKDVKPKRSNFNLFINGALILFSSYRLYSHLQKENPPTFGIVVSAFIIIICCFAIITTLRERKKLSSIKIE